ncbi:MAG: hypothetical protein J7M25_01080 [Deltaproteobacteria bacterium]|nr:hypothetical protein [Deltaproteobacteria bacterium]
MKRMLVAVAIVAAALFAGSCGDHNSGGSTVDGTVGDGQVTGDGHVPGDGQVTGDGQVSDGTVDGGWNSDVCHVTECAGHVYACGDCLDNDSDGKIDSRDPDCLGPCDNNETGFNTEIPGGNNAPCRQECYFDQDTGAGNDDCYWDHHCDPLEPAELNQCDYSKTCSNCQCDSWESTQSQTCLDFCLPIVPNGCDCFGCCEFATDDWRFIGSPGCSRDNFSACTACTPVPSCLNDCGVCEICLGKTELPPECNNQQTCPDGQQLCGQPGDDPCPEGYFCLTGCCVATIQ